ncbi:efflux transporter outer membrane subunit [Sphingomonas sp. ASV193]|uniref:efflux transporter outer membrane subunit n=1 Tax=Sphingomonas sp. ASV193 TaxID=3144405 RepID=UPI0032E8E3E6
MKTFDRGRRFRRLTTLTAVALALAACAPDLGPRPTLVQPASLASRQSLAVGPVSNEWLGDKFWTRYDDPQLNALVEEALANSPTLAQAVAKIRTAKGVAYQSGSALLPQVEGSGEAGFKKQSYNNGIPAEFVPHGWKSYGQLGLSGDFDLDLWGRNKALLAAATSEAVATAVDARAAATALVSNVVEAYASMGVLYAEQDLLAASLKARQQSADLYAKRYKAGLDSQLPLTQANAAVATTAANLESVNEKITLEKHVLAALLGAGPDRGLSIHRPARTGPFARIPLPADAGIALAGRRPDIVAARLRVEAQGRRIDAAKADFMPNVSLSGLVGLMSLGIGKLFDPGSSFGTASAAFSLPIFDGGRRKGAFVQARGKYDELVASYNATVVQALKEVADAVDSRASVELQSAQAEKAAQSAAEGYRLAELRYKSGLTTYLDVLTAQTTLLEAQRVALDTRSRLLLTDIQLVRALGGGFAGPDAPMTSTRSDSK